MNTEQLRSIQWLYPELASGIFTPEDLRHFQGLFRVGSEDTPSTLTQNQLWSVQQMFPTDGLDVRDLRHYQWLFRVDDDAPVETVFPVGLEYTLIPNRIHFTLPGIW